MQHLLTSIFWTVVAVAGLMFGQVAGAAALDYPTRPPRIIAGYRLIGDWLGKRFRQRFIVENRPGAGNNLATETAVPDGYTLMLNLANARNCRLGGPAPCMPVSTCAGRAPPRTLGIG
jgi:tripartite-type tricarboxylate transporter receptor subunit TctC